MVRWNEMAQKYKRPKPGEPQVLWMAYEDMCLRPEAAITRIAEFIGVELTPELLDKVVEGSGFERIRLLSHIVSIMVNSTRPNSTNGLTKP